MTRERRAPLVAIKLLHTAVWAFFVASIVAVPLAARAGRFDWSWRFGGIVMVEVLVLVFNRMRCPLTDVAERYTDDRRPNFDIYLPASLARYNKEIFGTLFLAGVVYAALLRLRA